MHNNYAKMHKYNLGPYNSLRIQNITNMTEQKCQNIALEMHSIYAKRMHNY